MEESYLYLVTVGRTSGKDREIEIWFVDVDGRYYLISETRERAHWVRNVRAEPRVRWRVGKVVFAGSARALDDARDGDVVRTVRELFDEKYQWSAGLVVELMPDRG